eukprot:10762310-Prorocentrum_lima.AAC.1
METTAEGNNNEHGDEDADNHENQRQGDVDLGTSDNHRLLRNQFGRNVFLYVKKLRHGLGHPSAT